jgi:hypothetical protein
MANEQIIEEYSKNDSDSLVESRGWGNDSIRESGEDKIISRGEGKVFIISSQAEEMKEIEFNASNFSEGLDVLNHLLNFPILSHENPRPILKL